MTEIQTMERFGVLPNVRTSGNLELQLRCLVHFCRAIIAEMRSQTGLPWNQRFKAWKSGFSSKSWKLYNLAENDPALYVPDFRGALTGYKINGFYNPILGNKLVLSRLLSAHHIPHPQIVSTVVDGQLFEEDARFDPDLRKALFRSLDRHPRQVFRPTWSGGGQGVFFLQRALSGLELNGIKASTEEVCRLLSTLDRYLATEFQEQRGYAKAIYPGTTNTIRILTLWDKASGGPFIAGAVHRFGASRSQPLDSWHQGRGGVCAAVDLASTALGKAVWVSPENKLVWQSSHPDTGAPIEGVRIPGFGLCAEGVIEAASHFPFCPIVGWDVVLTEGGFSILEANTLPSFAIMQVHAPLLREPRVRRFFQPWGLTSE